MRSGASEAWYASPMPFAAAAARATGSTDRSRRLHAIADQLDLLQDVDPARRAQPDHVRETDLGVLGLPLAGLAAQVHA